MTERNTSIADGRYAASVPSVPTLLQPPTGELRDTRGRLLHDLRISVTDRCNFRCTYCMPKSMFGKDYAFLPQSSLLSFEEILRLVGIFIAHGVEKVRLTGGEPLLRKDVERLVGMLASQRTLRGEPLDLTLTTNGSLLARKASALRDAGLRRVTVSLDALDDAVFRAMNDVDFPVGDVLEGVEAAARAGFAPVKVNMVVRRGVNDAQILPMARHFRGTGHILRFIEFMDVGVSNGWRMDEVLPSAEVVRRIGEHFPLEPADPNYAGEVAERWRYLDGAGEIGVISSVTQPFCSGCTRARLSTEGRLYTCLFAERGHDLRALLRGGRSDEEIAGAIAQLWGRRADRYSELRSADTATLRRIEMSYIGG
ncbi:GTP 3',8-cyclase MoaA [Quisquiliibacterium transsilvanicum]|uniref:GTP 3',8-cyclase n=1 Tax=Quisquiliibacterium transsilvanicum TaxID=1549638 RepID=A0A7W8HE41_9BURK|nr:GTP 3',8-cyclase MoaA [Quisquiliibacterium transsilvanicum]MBB5270275.1 cyclic pyranopterin phosphate synthase [Quisquiliibacterium transsilvanicum]